MDPLYPSFPLFSQATEGPEEAWDLFRAAVCLAENDDPSLDPMACEDRVQAFADEIRRRGIGKEDGEGAARAVSTFLFQELGYAGAVDDYYDPDNGYVHRVLERRKGIPITLTLILIETARRTGLPMSGVSFPGHFLARYDGSGGPVFLDAFGGGRVVDDEGLRRLLRENLGERVRLRPEFLAPAGTRQVLVRVLRNLQNAHLRQARFVSALEAVDKILRLQPGDATAQHARKQIESLVAERRG